MTVNQETNILFIDGSTKSTTTYRPINHCNENVFKRVFGKYARNACLGLMIINGKTRHNNV